MAMEQVVGDAGEVDEGEEEALDAALDMELAATYAKHPVVDRSPSEPATHGGGGDVIREPTMSQLTFAFPGWEIGISKSGKRATPSVSRIMDDAVPSKKGKRVRSPAGSECWGSAGSMRAGLVASADSSAPVEGCPADAVDDEILACVFMRLSVRDLCAGMRTCKRWHRVACKEDVWVHIPLPANGSGALPRWMEVRNAGMSMDLRIRFQVFRRGYEFVRSALNAWWDHGKPDGKHPSAIFRSLTQKLVINDWSLLYEAFGAAFSDRADHVAVVILAAIERIVLSRRFERREMVTDATGSDSGNGLAEMFSNLPSKTDGDLNATGNDREENSWDEFEVQEVWVLVLSLWRRYKRWLLLVVSHCPELNHEVMAERARSNALAMTPTVYGKGIICFRSQVILKYGIRSVLQATWSGLASAKRSGIASDNQLDLFRSADHLFQETSVLDDLTLSPTTFTQQKLRRCFGNETSSKTKPRGKPNPTALS